MLVNCESGPSGLWKGRVPEGAPALWVSDRGSARGDYGPPDVR